MTLTAKRISKLIEPGRYSDGHGLYLQVMSPDNRSWLFRYERNNRERWAGLGPLHTVSLKEARERARRVRLQLLDGIDPIDARKAQRATRALEAARALTFEKAARDYFGQHAEKWRNPKHRAQFLSTLEAYVFPTIGHLSVADIDTGLVLRCIEPIWKRVPETAGRVRNRIEAVLDWATIRGSRSGDNPARWVGHLDNVLPARSQLANYKHHPALPYAQMPAFIASLSGREGVAARALEFLILTAGRTGEVIGAQWNEIDLKAKTWTIPAERMKARKIHKIPLNDRAVEILGALPREEKNPFVFIGPRRSGLSNMAMMTVLRRMKQDNATVHGFRSSFRDWAAERTNYANHVVEMALAHTISNQVEAAYRRGDLFDKRRRLMKDWAEYCAKGSADASVHVVRLREAS